MISNNELDAFIGRRVELVELESLVEAGARLITIRGPGGVGKTRLAQHFAMESGAKIGDRPTLWT